MKRQVHWIPISALKGHNVKERMPSGLAPWAAKCCGGMSLIEKLDATKVGGRNPDAPLRMPVLDRYTDRGLVVMGKARVLLCLLLCCLFRLLLASRAPRRSRVPLFACLCCLLRVG